MNRLDHALDLLEHGYAVFPCNEQTKVPLTRNGFKAATGDPELVTTWWAGVRSGRFPRSVKLGPHTTAWRVEDIRALIDSLAAVQTRRDAASVVIANGARDEYLNALRELDAHARRKHVRQFALDVAPELFGDAASDA